MSWLKRAGKSGAIDVAQDQSVAKNQLGLIVDILRQLVGNPNIASGSTESTDPLTAPFHLYVDDIIGRDTFVTGDYNSFEASGTEEQKIQQKLKRVREQRLECGYTKASPFKTLNRAALEAYIITSLNWYTFTDPRAHRDCVIIHMGSGPQFIYNHPGSHASAVAISAWADGKVPTWQELIAFNDNTLGGVILPRGAAFDGEDLRKTTLIPMWAPAPADIASDYSNIRCCLYLTPDVHAVDFTFRDPIGQNQSLHLLYALGYPSQAQLNQFYGKAFTALGSGANLSAALSVARVSEYQVVGAFAGTPTPAWDTVQGASAYPERISLRSEWGMGGLFINGDNLLGLKSTVTAQFTGVSLQKDRNSLQVYSGGNWITPSSHQAYIDTAPNDRRVKPQRAHCHLLVIRDAFCSEVSVFGVGHTARARADLGGEIVSSNGNFTFGSCAAIATGYKRVAAPLDKDWLIDRISVPLSLSNKAPAIRRITLGVVASHNASSITLLQALSADDAGATPQLLAAEGYSLPGGTYVWVENPEGNDWRALLSTAAWVSNVPARINITSALSEGGPGPNTNAAVPSSAGVSNAIGKLVYIRRVVDNRTLAERLTSLELITSAGSRTPNRSAILQTSQGVLNGGIARALAADGEEVIAVTTSIKTATGARVTLRRSCPSVNYTVGTFYRKGVTVKATNKHFKAIRDNYAVTSTPSLSDWDEAYVHMPEDYNPEEPYTNESPQIVFNTDTDSNDITSTCGIDWATVFSSSGPIRDQYRTGTDVLGVYALLRALGFSDSAAWTALAPRSSTTRRLDPSSTGDFPTAPSGGAASSRARWAVEFRRPTTITLSNFTYDQGAGHGNYSNALPAAQKSMSASNLFSLYFTNGGGGRVVVNGVNEHGQLVTNRGLTDTETGETVLSGDQAGGESSKAPDSFSNITINGLIGSGTWNLSALASLIFPTASAAKITALGTGRLASAEALRSSSNIVTGGNDTERNASIENSPELVTVRGFNYALKERGVLTRRAETTVLYVVPNSATAAGQTFVFNGVSATLTLNPARSVAEAINNPPITAATAVTFGTAIEYANSVFSQYETVEYRLANGPYWSTTALPSLPVFLHIANVVGTTLNSVFPETAVVANYAAANTPPTTNVKAIHDARAPFLVPCFGTGIRTEAADVNNVFYAVAQPLQLNFRYGGSIEGICYLSVSATLADTANFPSNPSLFRWGFTRTSGITLATYFDDGLDAFVAADTGIYGFWGEPNIVVGSGTFTQQNVIYGAKGCGEGARAVVSYTIFVYGNATITSSGIYFLGNTILASSSMPKASSKFGASALSPITGCANTHFFVGSLTPGDDGISGQIKLKWPSSVTANPNGGSFDKNFDPNCIHILDNNGNYGRMANRSATDGTRGATMLALIGPLYTGSKLFTGGYDSWYTGYTNANKHHGMAGTFGNYGSSSSGPHGIWPQESIYFARDFSFNNSLWQMATSGNLLTSNVTLTSTTGGNQVSYDFPSSNALNLIVQAFYRGINVTTGQQVAGQLSSNRFFG